jgi:hypothetical protein
MRRLTGAAGLKMGDGLEEALHRLERGEDPETLEEEMGDVLGEDEPFVPGPGKRRRPGRRKPRVDEKLYEL